MIQKRDENCDIPLENHILACLKEFTDYLKHNSIFKPKVWQYNSGGFVATTG